MTAGRVAADVVSGLQGIEEMAGGVGLIGVGVGTCATGVLCLGGAAAVVGGAVVAAHGATVTSVAAVNAGNNLSNMVMKASRTSHADQRAQEGRPVSQAINDAVRPGSKVYRDTETGYYVVDPGKGRIHVFKVEDGVLKPHTSWGDQKAANTSLRLRNGQWAPLTEAEESVWQKLLKNITGGGD